MSGLIGIFGGTFDPIHQGHLKSILLLDQVCKFDRIHWVLSARPPHKDQVSASIEHRFAMLNLALEELDNYFPDDIEISREAKSYTFDTVKQFEQRFPNQTLCLIVGGDSLKKLHTWYRYMDLLDKVNLIVMHRPGYELEVPSYLEGRSVQAHQLTEYKAAKLVLFKQPEFDISSTEIRQTIQGSLNKRENQALVEQFLAKSVRNYISQHRLYK